MNELYSFVISGSNELNNGDEMKFVLANQSCNDSPSPPSRQLQENTQMSRDFFFEDFESNKLYDNWFGVPDAGTGYIVNGKLCRNRHGHCLAFDRCHTNGDYYTMYKFICSKESPCIISFWYRGNNLIQGFSKDLSNFIWTVHNSQFNSSNPIVKLPNKRMKWTMVQYYYAIDDIPRHVVIQSSTSNGKCSDTFIDDIQIKKKSYRNLR